MKVKATTFNQRMETLGEWISEREALMRREKIPKEPTPWDFNETGGEPHR